MPTQPDNLFCTTPAALALLAFACFISGAAAMGVLVFWRDWIEMIKNFLEPEKK